MQVSTLIFVMGREADNILDTFSFGEFDPQQDPDPSRDYGNVMNKFNEYFLRRRNLIHVRACLNKRRQKEGETALHS